MKSRNRVALLLEAYRQRPPEKAGQNLLDFAAEHDPRLFSHHPEGPAFQEHVWMARGMYLCKGCVVTFFGMVAGTGLFAVFPWLRLLSDGQAGGVFLALLAPTLLVAAFPTPRGFRHFARFLLGVLMVSAFFMLFVTDSWLARAMIVGTYAAVRIPLERKRNRLNREIAQCKGNGDPSGG